MPKTLPTPGRDSGTWGTELNAYIRSLGLSVQDYGAVGDGSADDTAEIQAALDDLSDTEKTVVFPQGRYKTDGTLLIPDVDEATLIFLGGAMIEPTAGWGLKMVGANEKLRLVNPRVAIRSDSTATRGIWLLSSVGRVTMYDPVIWWYANPASGFCGIDIDDNCYWCDIYNPRIRPDSGPLNHAAHGIRYRNHSNAGRVIAGDINSCDNGVTIEGAGATTVAFTAFEDCVDAVEFVQFSGNDNAGSAVFGCRFEAVTNGVNFSQTTEPGSGNDNYRAQVAMNMLVDGTHIANPNGHEIGFNLPGNLYLRKTSGKIVFDGDSPPTTVGQVSGSLQLSSNTHVRIMSDAGDDGTGSIQFGKGSSDQEHFGKFDRSTQGLKLNGPIDTVSGAATKVVAGSGSPEGSVTAGVGSIYLRTGGGADTSFYVKESGSGNTGWVGK